MHKYDNVLKEWDKIYEKDGFTVPSNKESGNEEFDQGLKWLTENTSTILDFGCGNGIVLFWCVLYGTGQLIGIDLSKKAIENAKIRSEKMSKGEFRFICGGVDELKNIESHSVDAVVLSNIIDNLYPEDAMFLLEEIKRILTVNGKVLVKLNAYITEREIEQYQIKVIEGNLLDDGLILWNNTTEQWTEFFEKYFTVVQYKDIYYEEYEQYNRMYLLESSFFNKEKI